MKRLVPALVAVAGLLFAAPVARAQEDMSDQWFETRNPASPENFQLQVGLGLYAPSNIGASFDSTFGPGGTIMPSVELDVIAWRLRDVLWLGVGGSFGFAGFSGSAYDTAGNRLSETTSLSVVPMALVGVIRVDVLARKLRWPFVLVGKLGLDFDYWSTGTGSRTDASGVTLGLRYAGQLQFELDFFDRKAARQLDEAWGINHSFLFFELYGVTGNFNRSLDVGTPIDWEAGLGFTF